MCEIFYSFVYLQERYLDLFDFEKTAKVLFIVAVNLAKVQTVVYNA